MKNPKNLKKRRFSGFPLVIPFFATMGILTILGFCIPLRPSQSQMEKRNLAQFPEFSWEGLASGDYLDDITLWFSDTFPGREGWITLSSHITSLHGNSEIAISGELPMTDDVPPVSEALIQAEATMETEAPMLQTEATENISPEIPEENTEAAWGGVDAGEDVNIEFSKTVVQIGDTAFTPLGFSQVYSDRYAQKLSNLADMVEDMGVRVVSAPAPTSVGILVEEKYLERLNSADQGATMDYLHGQMGENVVTVDTFSAILEHNNKYVYFRTDHHWTALGAYYAYEAICETLRYEAVPLEELEEWNQGEMEGSYYWKAPNPRKLKLDTLIAYIPKGDLELRTRSLYGEGTVRPLIQDMTNQPKNSKYSAFLFSDNPMVSVTNHSLPDGPTALVIKDSFGNALVPFLAQNYHTVYAIDYRKFHETSVRGFLDIYHVDDVIFTPYLIATQTEDGVKMLGNLCN